MYKCKGLFTQLQVLLSAQLVALVHVLVVCYVFKCYAPCIQAINECEGMFLICDILRILGDDSENYSSFERMGI